MIALPAALLANWRLLAAVTVVAAAAAVSWSIRGSIAERALAKLRADHSDQVAAASRRHADAQAEQRAIEAQRDATRQEIDHASSLARARADADRRSADAAHERLLNAARAAVARAGTACQDPSAAREREAAGGTSLQPLLDVLREAGEEASRMGEAADVARAAGVGCERYVDSLSQP